MIRLQVLTSYTRIIKQYDLITSGIRCVLTSIDVENRIIR